MKVLSYMQVNKLIWVFPPSHMGAGNPLDRTILSIGYNPVIGDDRNSKPFVDILVQL